MRGMMAHALTQNIPAKRTPAMTMAMPAVSTTVATTLADDSAFAPLYAYPNRGGPAVPQDLLNITPAQWAKCIRSATLLA